MKEMKLQVLFCPNCVLVPSHVVMHLEIKTHNPVESSVKKLDCSLIGKDILVTFYVSK